jgi:hypothetical protein
MKMFCIAGPVIPEDYYYIPHRLNWQELDQLINSKFYFVLHAPRQSGKTTAIREYIAHLNYVGNYTALYLPTEVAHVAKNHIEEALRWLLIQIDAQIETGDCAMHVDSDQRVRGFIADLLKEQPFPQDALYRFLRFWSKENTKPLILFLDEIDGLIENTLISLLKQFRTGYMTRPKYFPQTICLIGVRDLRDYKVKSPEETRLNALVSPFNIKATSLRLGNFSQAQVRDLYLQHTEATGQLFTDEAVEYAYYLTQGQPWLINALAYEACFSEPAHRSRPVTQEVIETAKEKLILRRDVHFDALLDRLNDKQVRSVLDPIISGSSEIAPFTADDLQYARDLGLIKQDCIEIANPLYMDYVRAYFSLALQKQGNLLT